MDHALECTGLHNPVQLDTAGNGMFCRVGNIGIHKSENGILVPLHHQ
jgi:hypothetical protein